MTRAIVIRKNDQNVIVAGGPRIITIKDAALASSILARTKAYGLLAEQAGNAQVYVSWSDLSGATGSSGDAAIIFEDSGTHSDPVVGGTVANAGIYQWSTSPAGWERVADTEAARADAFAGQASGFADDAAAAAAGAVTAKSGAELAEQGAEDAQVAAETAQANAEQAVIDAEAVNQAVSDALAVGTISDLVGDRIYSSRSALNADLVPADNEYALVVGDATPANNDLYQKNGATTAGSWDGPLGIFAAASAAAQAAADDAESAAAGVATALTNLTETDFIGRAVEPVDGTSGSANTRIFNNPVQRSGRVKKIWLWSSLTGTNTATLKAKVFDRDAGPGALVSGDGMTGTNAATVTITGGGLKVFDVDFPIAEGQFIGWHHSVSGAVDFKASTPSDSGGFWSDSGAVGDNLVMTANAKTGNAQWQIGFFIEVQVVTKDTERKADSAYSTVGTWLGQRPRAIPAIAADIDWAMCLSADFITPTGQEVGDSNVLREWLDRSGNGNSPATTTSPRPVYDPDAFGTGIPGVQFAGGVDGTGEARVAFLQLTMRLTQPFTVVAIVQIPAVNTAQLQLFDSYAYTTGSDPANRASLGLAIGGKPYIGIAPAMDIPSSDAISVDVPHLLIGTFNGSSSSIMVDGVVKATGGISGGLDGMVLGSGQANVRPWNGAVGLFGFVNGTLTTSQIAAIEAYAADRYAVTIS